MTSKNILIAIGGLLAVDYIIARLNKHPKIIVKDRVPFNYNALALPPFSIQIQAEDQDNEMLKKHELVHWEQYRKTGATLYYFKYGLQKMIFGYDKMPMEIEARKISGEKPECVTDYTACVRDGRANTVTDVNFRR
tara:strand:- start:638 stop:1045 length:408 start_codon:yes stop_codon:yes gene_type:complete